MSNGLQTNETCMSTERSKANEPNGVSSRTPLIINNGDTTMTNFNVR